jgi:hypothetical protein
LKRAPRKLRSNSGKGKEPIREAAHQTPEERRGAKKGISLEKRTRKKKKKSK